MGGGAMSGNLPPARLTRTTTQAWPNHNLADAAQRSPDEQNMDVPLVAQTGGLGKLAGGPPSWGSRISVACWEMIVG
jgi:hypothetical protein